MIVNFRPQVRDHALTQAGDKVETKGAGQAQGEGTANADEEKDVQRIIGEQPASKAVSGTAKAAIDHQAKSAGQRQRQNRRKEQE